MSYLPGAKAECRLCACGEYCQSLWQGGKAPAWCLFRGPSVAKWPKNSVNPAYGIIHTEIRPTSGIVTLHPKGTGYLLYPSRCRPLQAPRDFIRSSSSPLSDLNPAFDGARGTLNFRDRKREERK